MEYEDGDDGRAMYKLQIQLTIVRRHFSDSIHHFAGSWLEVPKYEEIETKFWKLFGLKNLNIINKIIWRFK